MSVVPEEEDALISASKMKTLMIRWGGLYLKPHEFKLSFHNQPSLKIKKKFVITVLQTKIPQFMK